MEELIKIDAIEDKIYEIRGKEVMLDSDLAELYHVETKRINEAVKNNPNKFPERYSWVLTINETVEISRSKFSTLKVKQGFNVKYGARVFTEQGVYMLATILKSKVATEVSLAIMDTFVRMRHYINYYKEILPNRVLFLESKVEDNTLKINELFDKFNPKEIVKDKIYFEGEYYDSYSFFMDILSRSKKEIIIIDNYVDNKILDILKTMNLKIVIVSKHIDEKLVKNYNKQYDNITFIKNSKFHDRFIIIDRNYLYSCGASFKDIGKRCFVIMELNDKNLYLNKILSEIDIENINE